MNLGDESAAVDSKVLERLLAVATAIKAGRPGSLPDRLTWESECVQLLDRVWPRAPTEGEEAPLPVAVGRFEVVRELGRGGFGVVYLARDPRLGREVAVKVPLPGVIASPAVRRRFLREARLVSSLDHPNIVPVHDAQTVGPVVYIVSAYCPGPSLLAWLKARTEPVPPRVAARLARDLARGVGHAHARGVLHRDLKPANVLLQPGGDAEAAGMTPRVTDFGLAKLSNEARIDESRAGQLIGSAPYMAPEQVAASWGEVGPATDVYALGATLYEILVGRPPFVGSSQAETWDQVLHADLVAPQLLRRDIPRDLQTICLHALRKNPSHRYPSAAAFEADLDRFLNDEPIQARPASVVERGWRWARRHPAPASALASTVLLITLIGLGMAGYGVWLRAHNDQLRALNGQLRALNGQLRHEVDRADRHAAEVERQRLLVADREAVSDRHLHAARLHLAWQAVEAGQNERAQAILADVSVASGSRRRDFPWRYLWSLSRRELGIWGRHESRIRRLVLSPAGTTLASGDQSGRVHLWDVATQSLKATLSGQLGMADELAFSPDGTLLAVGGRHSADPAGAPSGVIQEVASGRLLARLDLAGAKQVSRLFFTNDGQSLVVLGVNASDAQVVLGWNLAICPDAALRLKPRFTLASCVAAVGAPDGRSFWTSEEDGRLLQRDATTGAVVRELGSAVPGLAALAVAANGRRLAGSLPPARVLVWDLEAGGAPRELVGSRARPDELTFCPDSSALLIQSAGSQVRLVHLDSGRADELVPFHPERLGRYQFAFSPDGRRLVSTGGVQPGGVQPVTLWNVATGRPERSFPGRLAFSWAGFDAQGRSILLGNDYDVAVWNLFAPVETVDRFDDHDDEVWSVAFAPDGRTVASGGDDDRIRFWDPVTKARSHVIPGHDATVSTLAWHPRGATIASGSLGMTDNLKLWDARTGASIATLPGHTERIRAVVFSPDGAILASTGSDRTIRLWDGLTGQPRGQLIGHDNVVRGLAFSKDGRYLTSVANDATVRVWDWAAITPVQVIREQYHVAALAYSPDGTTLASADEGGFIHLRDSKTLQLRRVIQSDDREIRALTFSPDGETLVAAGNSRTIRFWDPVTGQPLLELREGTSDQVNALAFSPDGSLLLAADHGGRTLIYRGPQ